MSPLRELSICAGMVFIGYLGFKTLSQIDDAFSELCPDVECYHSSENTFILRMIVILAALLFGLAATSLWHR